MKAYFRVGEKGWYPNTLPKSYRHVLLSRTKDTMSKRMSQKATRERYTRLSAPLGKKNARNLGAFVWP